jgi:hypothetical protein
MKWHIGALLIALACITAGCTSPADTIATNDTGLAIVSFTESLGTTANVTSWQTCTYTATFINNDDRNVRIVWIEPVIAPMIRNRLPEQNLRQSVEATIGPGRTANVTGAFLVTVGMLSKEEIDRLGPFVLGFRVMSDQIVTVPGVM